MTLNKVVNFKLYFEIDHSTINEPTEVEQSHQIEKSRQTMMMQLTIIVQ